jgi:hypothetical protein
MGGVRVVWTNELDVKFGLLFCNVIFVIHLCNYGCCFSFFFSLLLLFIVLVRLWRSRDRVQQHVLHLVV